MLPQKKNGPKAGIWGLTPGGFADCVQVFPDSETTAPMVKLRLQRHGNRHNPVYRIVAAEALHPRDGRHCEMLGHYAPKARGNDPEYRLNLQRAEYWLSHGAQATDTVRSLIRRARRDAAAYEASIAAQPDQAPATTEAATASEALATAAE